MMQDKRECQIRELEATLSEMELERVKMVNVSSERLRALKELKLEREDMVAEIKASRVELATLAGRKSHVGGLCCFGVLLRLGGCFLQNQNMAYKGHRSILFQR